jgi:hypothetical protein
MHQRQPDDHVVAQPVHGVDGASGRKPAHRQPRPLRKLPSDEPPHQVVVDEVHTGMHLPSVHGMSSEHWTPASVKRVSGWVGYLRPADAGHGDRDGEDLSGARPVVQPIEVNDMAVG